MPTFAIFDTYAGLLQWIGDAESSDAAIKALQADNRLCEESNADLDVALVTSDQAAKLIQWADTGSCASEYPSGIDLERVSVDRVARLLGFATSQ